MANILTSSGAYHGTFTPGTVEVEPNYQICAVANLNASNQFECSFWINRNGERVDSDLGSASFRIRDKAGALVSGLAQTGITPDVNGYWHSTPLSAALLYDLNHYILEIDLSVDGVERTSSIGLVQGE